MLQGLREINYYPSVDGWGGVWQDWRPAMLGSDMARIASLGANAVRIFLQPGSFGYPTPSPRYLDELGQMIGIAHAHGLRVHLTLFDLWNDYSDLAGSMQWAAAVLQPFRGDGRIAAVELQNEIDPDSAAAMSWARAMLPAIRSDSDLPVTVSVTDWNSAASLARLIGALGAVQPDFYDLHFYGTPSMAPSVLNAAKAISAGKPLLIGETGYSTYQLNMAVPGVAPTTAAHESAQASYFSAIEQDARQLGLPPVPPWTLYDFAPSAYISPTEQHFGLYRADGSAKPAVAAIKAAFSSAPATSARTAAC